MNLQPVTSSQIAAIGFDPETNTLHVQFKGKNGPGSVYSYSGVTAADHQALISAPSIGTHFGKHIKSAKDEHGNLQFPHTLRHSAVIEAERLARANAGKRFIVMQAMEARMVDGMERIEYDTIPF